MKVKCKVAIILVIVGVAGIGGFLYYRWQAKPRFSYNIKKIREDVYSAEENLTVTVSGDVVNFKQYLDIFSNALDGLVLNMGVGGEEIVIKEIWNTSLLAGSNSLFRIIGTINNLESGTYHMTFNLTSPKYNILNSTILYERNITI